MSLANKHIIAGIVRPTTPDAKRALPRAVYMKRFHVSKWKCVQDQQTKTLAVVHALVPERKLFAYCQRVQRTFLSWLPPYNKNLCSKLSLQDILDCELDCGAVYFINTVDFTGPDPSDRDYAERSCTEPTFGLQIQSYNGTVPTGRPNSWETTRAPVMDDHTRREMGLPPRLVSSATVPAAAQRPGPGSYRADGPSVSQEVIIDVDRPSVQEAIDVDGPSALQATIDASFNEPQRSTSSTPSVSIGRPTDLYTCPCCYEQTHMCVFNCGHVACENCILKSVTVSGLRRCFYCKSRWTWYRFVRMSSVSQDVICSDCAKAKMYIKPCGHASCECPNPVCSECVRGETVRLYL